MEKVFVPISNRLSKSNQFLDQIFCTKLFLHKNSPRVKVKKSDKRSSRTVYDEYIKYRINYHFHLVCV